MKQSELAGILKNNCKWMYKIYFPVICSVYQFWFASLVMYKEWACWGRPQNLNLCSLCGIFRPALGFVCLPVSLSSLLLGPHLRSSCFDSHLKSETPPYLTPPLWRVSGRDNTGAALFLQPPTDSRKVSWDSILWCPTKIDPSSRSWECQQVAVRKGICRCHVGHSLCE